MNLCKSLVYIIPHALSPPCRLYRYFLFQLLNATSQPCLRTYFFLHQRRSTGSYNVSKVAGISANDGQIWPWLMQVGLGDLSIVLSFHLLIVMIATCLGRYRVGWLRTFTHHNREGINISFPCNLMFNYRLFRISDFRQLFLGQDRERIVDGRWILQRGKLWNPSLYAHIIGVTRFTLRVLNHEGIE